MGFSGFGWFKLRAVCVEGLWFKGFSGCFAVPLRPLACMACHGAFIRGFLDFGAAGWVLGVCGRIPD